MVYYSEWDVRDLLPTNKKKAVCCSELALYLDIRYNELSRKLNKLANKQLIKKEIRNKKGCGKKKLYETAYYWRGK